MKPRKSQQMMDFWRISSDFSPRKLIFRTLPPPASLRSTWWMTWAGCSCEELEPGSPGTLRCLAVGRNHSISLASEWISRDVDVFRRRFGLFWTFFRCERRPAASVCQSCCWCCAVPSGAFERRHRALRAYVQRQEELEPLTAV